MWYTVNYLKLMLISLVFANPKRRTNIPTAKALQSAFSYIDFGIEGIDGISYHLTPLSTLQQYILELLELLDLPQEIYTQLME